jgi:thiol-disulfide isomerase/thioredoxin
MRRMIAAGPAAKRPPHKALTSPCAARLCVFTLVCTALVALLLAAGSAAEPKEVKLGEFIPTSPPQPAPAVEFTDMDGKPAALADFKGRPVLVNLWATWCQPCLKEMPELAAFAKRLDGKLRVAAISEDRGGAGTVAPFLAKHDFAGLSFYLDPKGAATQAFAVRGLPTSLLIGPDGKLLGKVEGAAEWDKPEMQAALAPFLTTK